MTRGTHTSAIVEITPMAFMEIRQKLEAAGYPVDGDEIDMHGLMVKAKTASSSTSIEVGKLLSHRTKRGVVELCVNGERVQMEVSKAREVLGMLSGAIEAAISDEVIYAFLTTKVGLSDEQAGAALLDFRELRQGSKSTVYPA